MITERLLSSSRHWAFAALASLLIVILQAGGNATRFALQYDRAGLQAGEWYRLLSGHWIHLDWRHALMNMAGLWLLALIDVEERTARRTLLAGALRSGVLSVAVGLALYVRVPQLDWYLGLSGVLHGLFVIVLLRALWWRRDALTALVVLLLIGKLVWEHYHGALTQDVLGAPVIVSAHSYGAAAGLAYAVIGGMAAVLLAKRADHRSRRFQGD
jgi:rhomboid family GlyGly-CTERM serine protease